jgi:hypothetical protein
LLGPPTCFQDDMEFLPRAKLQKTMSSPLMAIWVTVLLSAEVECTKSY